MGRVMRSPTLAVHGETVLHTTRHLIETVRTGDLDAIELAVAEVRSMVPPDGVDPVTALIVALAVQIDPTIPFEQRVEWLHAHDPAARSVYPVGGAA